MPVRRSSGSFHNDEPGASRQPDPGARRRRIHDRQQLGRAAEDAAARFLESRGLTILARNVHCRGGEIDIVARGANGVVIIVEVRSRADARYGSAAASVDWHKQRRIQRAACHLIARQPALARAALRFDVLDLRPDGAGDYRIEWIRHAFEAAPR